MWIKKRREKMGIADYYRRKKARLITKVALILALIYPITVMIFSLLYIKLSLIFSPLNLVSISLKPTFPGYFSSNWQLTLRESDLIADGIDELVYDLKIFHGPVISQKVFGENKWFFQRIFTMWKRAYPVYFEITPANTLANELHAHGVKFSLSLNWTGQLKTEFMHPYWESMNTQNLFSRYNRNELSFQFPESYHDILGKKISLNFEERWSLLGHKNVTLHAYINKIKFPERVDTLENLSMTFRYQASEPRSQITLLTRGLLNKKTGFDANLVIGDFFTKNFSQSYQIHSDDFLSFLLDNKSHSFNRDHILLVLNKFLDDLDPSYLSFNMNSLGENGAEYIDLDYNTFGGFQLRGEVEQPLSQELYHLLSELS
jgi:hypothetical protein